jgi:dihydrofolate reductase
MKAIISKNAFGFIGLNNKLIWHCKEDLQHFARMTANSTLLAGYNTYMSLPTLKGRIVRLDPRRALFHDLSSIDWCIGGAKTYDKYCHLFTELHISTIVNNFQVGDTMMPKLENLNPNCKIFNYQFIIKNEQKK